MANEFKIKNGLSIGGNTSGTTILKSALAASGTLTLPAATDTLVGLATTDTLTNKTLSSVTLTGTVTAGGGVGTSGQVLSSTGTGVQWVNAGNGDVTQTGTQTLTNKTLTSPTINSATENNVTFTGTVTAGGSTGTNGYYLQTTGSGVQWAAVSSSGTSVFIANARSDLGYVYDASVTITEDLGTPIGTTTVSYDLAVLKVDGIVSLDNLDSSVKSDYLAQAIIFGF
jgi:hypothetical protein